MESNNTEYLRESVFFTARKARLPSPEESTACASSSDPASSSSRYYSARIHSLMERMSKSDMNEAEFEVEASKDHWTEVEPKYGSAVDSLTTVDSSTSESDQWSGMQGATDLELLEENLEFLRSLQEDDPASDLFQSDGDYVLGRKIGEGGQAEIYEVEQYTSLDTQEIMLSPPVVLKVFKAGYSLLDLRKQWPLALLHKLNPSSESYEEEGSGFCNGIYTGRLLGDGRFAFHMLRFWGDLRKFMDLRMQHNGNQHPPFMISDGTYLECCMLLIMWRIAMGMRDLHREGILHRDLKASNVLIESSEKLNDPKEEDFDPIELDHNFVCVIADFECSIGVVGTGYWRAPEILEAMKNRTWSTAPNLFTPKSDVYSYGMTCYEILTGCIPFEDIEDIGRTTYDDVLQGKRPKLPRHLKPWMNDLLFKCWHMDSTKRPTFEEIVDVLEGLLDIDDIEFFKLHSRFNALNKVFSKNRSS